MELSSYILSQSVQCWCIETLLVFLKLILYIATLLKLFMVSRSFLDLHGIGSCRLQM
jgi:hypothetical protein